MLFRFTRLIYIIAFITALKILVSENRTLKLLDLWRGMTLKEFDDYKSVSSIDCSENGQYYVFNSIDTVHVLNNSLHIPYKNIVYHGEAMSKLKISPTNKYLAASNCNSIYLYNFRSLKLKHTFKHHDLCITSLDFTQDDNYLVSSSYEHKIIIYNTKTGFVLKSLFSEFGSIVKFGSNNILMYGSYLGDVVLYDFESEKTIYTFQHESIVTTISFNEVDKDVAIVGCYDGVAYLYNISTGKLIRKLEGHTESITHAVFTKCGQFAITSSVDKSIIIWEINSHAGARVKSIQLSSPIYNFCIFTD